MSSHGHGTHGATPTPPAPGHPHPAGRDEEPREELAEAMKPRNQVIAIVIAILLIAGLIAKVGEVAGLALTTRAASFYLIGAVVALTVIFGALGRKKMIRWFRISSDVAAYVLITAIIVFVIGSFFGIRSGLLENEAAKDPDLAVEMDHQHQDVVWLILSFGSKSEIEVKLDRQAKEKLDQALLDPTTEIHAKAIEKRQREMLENMGLVEKAKHHVFIIPARFACLVELHGFMGWIFAFVIIGLATATVWKGVRLALEGVRVFFLHQDDQNRRYTWAESAWAPMSKFGVIAVATVLVVYGLTYFLPDEDSCEQPPVATASVAPAPTPTPTVVRTATQHSAAPKAKVCPASCSDRSRWDVLTSCVTLCQ